MTTHIICTNTRQKYFLARGKQGTRRICIKISRKDIIIGRTFSTLLATILYSGVIIEIFLPREMGGLPIIIIPGVINLYILYCIYIR